MRGLIYKDFVANRKSIIGCVSVMIYILVACFVITFVEDDNELGETFFQLFEVFILAIIFFLGGAFQGNMFREDESRKWAYFVASTPMTSRKQVESKYWVILIMSLVLLWFTSFVDVLCCHIYGTDSAQIFLMLMFFIQIVMRAFEIPFLVRFGSDMGSYYKVGVIAVFLLIVGIYLLFGDLSHFSSMDKIYEFLLDMISGENMGMMVAITALPYISAFLYYLSYRISCRLYLKGAENFEK
ncbi:MAG: ABC-2 transporter permease [Ruminococcus sp.]|nr:ABC-2 transporter permease [Ruminococcus sp.]